MNEAYEFRLPADRADDLGLSYVLLGEWVALVKCVKYDENYEKIRVASCNPSRTRAEVSVYSSWKVTRTYSTQEWLSASAVCLRFGHHIDVYSQDYGVKFGLRYGLYDIERPPLMPDQRGPVTRPQIWKLNSGEILCNASCAEVLAGSSSLEIIPIGKRGGAPFLLDVPGNHVDLSSSTIVGEGPFRAGPADPSREIVGLNIISEAHLSAGELPADWSATRQRIGHDVGFLRAQRLVLIKPTVRDRLIQNKVRGVRFEVARLVG